MVVPVDSKEAIVQRIMDSRQRLVLLGVRSIGLFGSFVRGQHSHSSDVDILIEFVPGRHTFDTFMDASLFLEEILGRKVELVTPESLSPHIGPHILREVERVDIAA